jgi:hypothetical protein
MPPWIRDARPISGLAVRGKGVRSLSVAAHAARTGHAATLNYLLSVAAGSRKAGVRRREDGLFKIS